MSRNQAGLVRRDVLRGAAAAAVGAVLLKDIPAARAGVTGGRTLGAPVGVTLNTSLFPRGTTMKAALQEWQKVTGCAPLSTKVYFGYRQYPRKMNSKVAACAALGMTAVLCYRPAYHPFQKADALNLEASLAALKQAGLKKACVVLWPEPQSTGHYRPNLSAAEFVAGSKYYASAARSAGWPVYWDSMGEQQAWASWCPGSAVDGYAVDDYASRGNWRDIWGPGGIALMADRDDKPFGWFEMGIAAGTTARPSTTAIKSFLSESIAYLASRANGTTGPVMWWGGNSRNALIPTGSFPANAWIAKQFYPSLYHSLAT